MMIPAGYFPFFIMSQLKNWLHTIVVTNTPQDITSLSRQIAFLDWKKYYHVLPFVPWDCLPYDRISPSAGAVNGRLKTLSYLSQVSSNVPVIVVTSKEGLIQRLIPKTLLAHQQLTIKKKSLLCLSVLEQFLIQNGYQRVSIVYESGDYVIRGDIIDVFPTGDSHPMRIELFGQEVERIRTFDPTTQRCVDALEQLDLRPIREVLLTPNTRREFINRYPHFCANTKDPLVRAVTDGRSMSGIDHWLPLFYPQTDTLIDYMGHGQTQIIAYDDIDAMIQQRLHHVQEQYHQRIERSTILSSTFKRDFSSKNDGKTAYEKKSMGHPMLPPDMLYGDMDFWQEIIEPIPTINFKKEGKSLQQNIAAMEKSPLFSFVYKDDGCDGHTNDVCVGASVSPEKKALFSLEDIHCYSTKNPNATIVINITTQGHLSHLQQIASDENLSLGHYIDHFPNPTHPGLGLRKGIIHTISPFVHGFSTFNVIFLTQHHILGARSSTKEFLTYDASSSSNSKGFNFFQEYMSIDEKDFVVHQHHGIGQYVGLKTINIDGHFHDCLQLEYQGGDQLFVPIEHLNLVSRYASSDAPVMLHQLGSKKWQAKIATTKKKLQEVAEYLFKTAAKRALLSGDVFDQHSSMYHDFCRSFPYAETLDQQKAINEVLNDLACGTPMDRLLCGDVGFGKTEVALRACFIVIAQKKQVVVVTPTTLLCRQHAQEFERRLTPFGFKVAQWSRLTPAKDLKKIRQDLKDGTLNLLIATHGILRGDVEIDDLGMIIIDEEQHFGVKQKEQLKNLKPNVHILSLSATPIPRTLQLSFSSIRSLSLITTPPVERLAVRTMVMPFDEINIQDALMREHNRGGQSFFVTHFLKDLPKIQELLARIVPSLRVVCAHGDMKSVELEEAISNFHARVYDILLCTNIIESGIDMASVNTIFIHKAHTFGLAQLYQLRGRVGRGRSQGYAYLLIPFDGMDTLTSTAQKRLEFLSQLEGLGGGFRLAAYDLDMRGGGNLLGEEQSGHIKEIGMDLYYQFLNEEIYKIRLEEHKKDKNTTTDEGVKNEELFSSSSATSLSTISSEKNHRDHQNQQDLSALPWHPQINLGISVLIPESYIADLGIRMGLYQRLSRLNTSKQLADFAAEMTDRFGPYPKEVEYLVRVMDLKHLCCEAKIIRIHTGTKGMVIGFHESFQASPSFLEFLNSAAAKQLGVIKMRPNNELVILNHHFTPQLLFKVAKILCMRVMKDQS
jgi:transcription-repair coupling factor (superfamily II helicase)